LRIGRGRALLKVEKNPEKRHRAGKWRGWEGVGPEKKRRIGKKER